MIDRSEEAKALFKEGFNCSQAVFVAYAEDLGMDKEMAMKVSASFGGGMGRMREVCGTVSGMFLVNGMLTGSTVGRDAKRKQYNYEIVQELARRFKEQNGSIVCAQLLGLDKAEGSAVPEARTAEYYKKRPCLELVGQAASIVAETLTEYGY